MKKLLMLTAIVCSVVLSPVAHAEWTPVSVTRSAVSYVKFDSIRKKDGMVYYWFLTNFYKPQKTGFNSAQIYIEAECDRFRFRFLNWVTFKGPMASGKISSSRNSPDKDWRYPNPNSVYEFTLNVVCNHKSMQ